VKITQSPDGTITIDTGGSATAAKGVAEWDGESMTGVIAKASDELQYTLVCVYPADKADVAVAADGHRDFASKGAVREAAWNFLRKGGNVGLAHADGTDGAGTIVESFLWPGDDWATKSGYVVKGGDWMAGIVWDDPAWELVKAGKIGGVSMQGSAKRRTPTAEAIAALRE
jgi:hypothetical protein